MYEFSDHYIILNIPFAATHEEIKQAYRKKARETHPDVGGSQDEFINVRKAYDVLINPEKRRHYDIIHKQYYQGMQQDSNTNKKHYQSNHQERKPKQEAPETTNQSSTSRETHPKGSTEKKDSNVSNSIKRSTFLRVAAFIMIMILLYVCIEMTYEPQIEDVSYDNISPINETSGEKFKERASDDSNQSDFPYLEKKDIKDTSDFEDQEEVVDLELSSNETGFESTEEISDILAEVQNIDTFTSFNVPSGTFSLGSTQEEVKSIMGVPTSISSYDNSWGYKFSTVFFNSNNQVIGWSDISNNLRVFLGDAVSNATFTLGSSKLDVVHAMGTPNSISTNVNSWDYEFSTVHFSSDNKVIGWSDISNNLRAFLGNTEATTTFTLGSNKQDVILAMGTPSSISTYDNSWDYQFSTVHFNSNNQVIGWTDISNNLRAFLGQATENATFTSGSTKLEVIAAMGTPTSVSAYNNSWDYDFSTVRFDDTNKVVSWSNISENLKVR